MLSKVYRYGLLAPIEGASLVDEQFRLAARYKNKLIEIERWRRAELFTAQGSEEKKHVEKQAGIRRIEARSACGVYWGTYLCVEADANRAIRSTPQHEDPSFHAWTGEGIIAVQLQKDEKPDGYFKITDVQDTVNRKPGSRRAGQRRLLWIRVGSVKRKPVWAKFPLTFHRSLPGVPSWVKITRRREATRWVYEAHFTVSTPEASRGNDRGLAAIDIGWRGLSGDLRVATWRGSDGQTGVLHIPKTVRDRIEKAESIRSLRDQAIDALRLALQAVPPEAWPDEVRDRRSRLEKWRSPRHFARLLRDWQRVGSPPDFLCAWEPRDRHLWQYETGLRSGALRHRNDIYRNFAAMMVQRYSDLVVEDISLREFAEYNEGETRADKAAPGQRYLAGHSVLKAALINAFDARRGYLIKIDAAGTTRTCADCGYVNPKQITLMITCAGCGRVYDRDHNATRNILARGVVVREEQISLAQENRSKAEGMKKARLVKMAEGRRRKKECSKV